MIEKGHLKTIDTFLDELVENEMILTMAKKIILNVTEWKQGHLRMNAAPVIILLICHFFYTGKILENKTYTEKRQFFALNL